MKRQKLCLLLASIISLALLIPGITKPLISLQADIDRKTVVAEGKKLINEQKLHPVMLGMASQFLDGLKVHGTARLYDKTRSILGTATDLFQSGYMLVALLIIVFSVIIPSIKTLLLLTACLLKKNVLLLRINQFLGKWSMADVFAMGVIIACLAANGSASQKALLTFHAKLHAGFYYFLAYCLISISSGQLTGSLTRANVTKNTNETA